MPSTKLNELEQALIDGYAAGRSYRDLGQTVGLSHETVRIVLGRLGVAPRSMVIDLPDREASARRVKELRGRLGLSIDKFARFLTDLAEGHRLGIGVAYATIGYWERGDRVPTGPYLKVLELAEDVAADMGRKC